ncbi:MAG: hypothetical protein N2508_04805 [Anaerolineae bacterium]|nr:hypothetical protein [Anaerolineae bacterium]
MYILIIACLSFALHQAPYVFSSMPASIGADGDSAFHFAIQMKLRDPTLFPKDIELNEMHLSSRPAFEFMIHRSVIWVADHLMDGNLFIANIAGFWFYHLTFLAGCYCLGLFVLKSPAGATLFAAASVGLSKAFVACWGMGYGAVIPKYVGLTFIPWFMLGYLCWRRQPWRLVLLFFLLGLSVNIYPLLPLYLALILAAVTLLQPRPPLAPSLLMGAVFVIAALPSVIASALGAFEKMNALSPYERSIREALLVRHYSHALLNVRNLAAVLVSPIWFPLTIAGVQLFLKPLTDLAEKDKQFVIRFAMSTIGWGVLWLAAQLIGRLRFLLAHTVVFFVWMGWFTLWAFRMRLFERPGVKENETGKQLALFAIWTTALSLAGFLVGAVCRPLLTFLFYRASAFLYIPAYLGCIRLAIHLMEQRTAPSSLLGLGLALVIVLNSGIGTTLYSAIRRVQFAQTSEPYYALAEWAAENTPADSLFMMPYGARRDTFFAFRVYSARGVLLNWATGEVVISNPDQAVRFWQISQDIEPLYRQEVSTADFVRVAHKYDVDYIVTDRSTPRPPDLPVAYRNETYTVFIVPLSLIHI